MVSKNDSIFEFDELNNNISQWNSIDDISSEK